MMFDIRKRRGNRVVIKRLLRSPNPGFGDVPENILLMYTCNRAW